MTNSITFLQNKVEQQHNEYVSLCQLGLAKEARHQLKLVRSTSKALRKLCLLNK